MSFFSPSFLAILLVSALTADIQVAHANECTTSYVPPAVTYYNQSNPLYIRENFAVVQKSFYYHLGDTNVKRSSRIPRGYTPTMSSPRDFSLPQTGKKGLLGRL